MHRTIGTLRRHLRSNLIAYLALFVALGGTSFAAVKIKNNSITGAKVKNDSLTGADVAESTLGKVGSAGTADSAGNATQLGGIPASQIVDGKASVKTVATPIANSGSTTVLDLTGIGQVRATCSVGAGNEAVVWRNTSSDVQLVSSHGATAVVSGAPLPVSSERTIDSNSANGVAVGTALINYGGGRVIEVNVGVYEDVTDCQVQGMVIVGH